MKEEQRKYNLKALIVKIIISLMALKQNPKALQVF